MSFVYKATLHTITRNINDFVDKCAKVGIKNAEISPEVHYQLFGNEMRYIIYVSGLSADGKKAKLVVDKLGKKIWQRK